MQMWDYVRIFFYFYFILFYFSEGVKFVRAAQNVV